MGETTRVGVARSINLLGLNGSEVLIEAALLPGLPNFTIVGLGDAAVNEARERLRAGLQNIGVSLPSKRLTINLSPADKVKSGSGFDLGIAGAIFGALEGVSLDPKTVVFGEIGLAGEVRQISGILPSLLLAWKLGFRKAIVPAANYHEAKLIDDLEIVAVSHLGQFARLLGIVGVPAPPLEIPAVQTTVDVGNTYHGDLNEVCGQDEAIWALIIAAIGGHHVQMVGPPGVGKSMLAERFVDILPPLTSEEAIEVAAIKSVCGEQVDALPKRRPLVSPHHTASSAALIGGGNGIPQPGAITRAHHGVLYCDEFPEFANSVIQSLRQPLEQGWIELHRVRAKVRYPARFQLIAAANPCRCGYLLDGSGKCTCSVRDRLNYRSALAGPITDRIDLQLTLRRPKKVDLLLKGALSTEQAREKVQAGRARAAYRNREVLGIVQKDNRGKTSNIVQLENSVQFANTTQEIDSLSRADATPRANTAQPANRTRLANSVQRSGAIQLTNASLPGSWLREHTQLSANSQRFLDALLERGDISLRGVDRVLRISWSIADYFERDRPNDDDFATAFSLRNESQGRGKHR